MDRNTWHLLRSQCGLPVEAVSLINRQLANISRNRNKAELKEQIHTKKQLFDFRMCCVATQMEHDQAFNMSPEEFIEVYILSRRTSMHRLYVEAYLNVEFLKYQIEHNLLIAADPLLLN